MPTCVNCFIQLRKNLQYCDYFAVDLSPDFVSIIEEWNGHEISNDDRICQECVSLVSNEATKRVEIPGHQGSKQVGHECVCICCGISLGRRCHRRRHRLIDGCEERSYIQNVICPRQVPDEAWACHACWMQATAKVPRRPLIRPEQVYISTPVVEPRVKEEQEQAGQGSSDPHIGPPPIRSEEIFIPPPVEPRVEDDHGSIQQGASDPNIGLLPSESEDTFIPPPVEPWVEEDHGNIPQGASDPNNPPSFIESEDNFILQVEEDHGRPEQAVSGSRSNSASPVSDADSWAELNLTPAQRVELNRTPAESGEQIERIDREDTLSLPNYRRTADASKRCYVPKCENRERRRIKMSLRREILKKHKLYITPNARVCQNHYEAHNWEEINEFIPTFTARQIEGMLNLLNND